MTLANKGGYTPLHISLFAFEDSKDHTFKIERLLLDAGADVNALDNDGRSPIFFLFYKNQNTRN